MFICALPMPPGALPETRKLRFWLASTAICASNSAMSIMLALAGRLGMAQRRLDGDDGIEAGEQVGDRDAGLLRLAAGLRR